MKWIQKLFAAHNSSPPHISANNTAEERARRLASLSEEEQPAYKWLFNGYTEVWTTETLGLEKSDAKKLYNGIYRKLGIRDPREIVRYYAPREIHFIDLPGADEENKE